MLSVKPLDCKPPRSQKRQQFLGVGKLPASISFQELLAVFHGAVSESANDPQLSHGHWRPAHACNLDSHIS